MTETDPRQIQWLPLTELVEDPRNPKAHSDDLIDASIDKHGVIDLITRDDRTGYIVSGHGRKKALTAQHARGTTPPEGVRVTDDGTWLVPVVTGWSSTDDLDSSAVLIKLNRLTELGGWVDESLLGLLDDLRDTDQFGGVGFGLDDIEALRARLKQRDSYVSPDALPEMPTGEPISQEGNLWILGDHRLVVGSSTETKHWDLLLEGEQATGVWTDPPYGVDYKGGAKPRRAISGDAKPSSVVPAVFDLILTHTRPGATWYVTVPAGPSQAQFENWLNDRSVLRQGLIWVKNNATFGRTDYHYQHEPILYGRTPSDGHGRFGRLGSDGQGWWGDHSASSVLIFDRPASSAEHPTMKPVALVERCLMDGTPPGGIVLDPFAGSGTTLIAAEATGRKARCIELDLYYADVICRRFQEYTGIIPTRNGEPHDFTRP